MPNLTTPFLHLGGTDIDKDMDDVQNWSIALIDELKYILCNLDAGNCMEAGKVQAKNIDCSKARISSAQIQSLKASKIKTGTLDVSDQVTIQGESDDARMVMNSQTLIFYEKDKNGNEIPRIYAGYDKDKGKYVFEVYNKEGQKEIKMDDNGDVVFSGTIKGGKIEADTDISVNKDVNIGQYLNVGYITTSVDENGNPKKEWSKESGIQMGPYVSIMAENEGNNLVLHAFGRIAFDTGSVTKGGVEIATERDIEDLQRQIDALEREIAALKQK
ncbi:MAG: SlyX family protein [Clostridia bacterium]|nr:SlyX family protein [Clostridia bacterium]